MPPLNDRHKHRQITGLFCQFIYNISYLRQFRIGTWHYWKKPRLALSPACWDNSSPEIVDLVASLSGAAHSLGSRLHPRSAESLAELVRVMNCYYSNLIEGHNTTPREIERALANQLDAVTERRNLQIEARAHIRLQREVDRRHKTGDLPEPASVSFIRWLHRSFYQDAPEAMLIIEGQGRKLLMTPGEFRTAADDEVSEP